MRRTRGLRQEGRFGSQAPNVVAGLVPAWVGGPTGRRQLISQRALFLPRTRGRSGGGRNPPTKAASLNGTDRRLREDSPCENRPAARYVQEGGRESWVCGGACLKKGRWVCRLTLASTGRHVMRSSRSSRNDPEPVVARAAEKQQPHGPRKDPTRGRGARLPRGGQGSIVPWTRSIRTGASWPGRMRTL
jgi:hypothetical protein